MFDRRRNKGLLSDCHRLIKSPFHDAAFNIIQDLHTYTTRKMSASSGVDGWCNVCSHANNEHNYYTCEAKGCRKKFKVCQTGSHQEWEIEAGYVLCKWCRDHPYACSRVDAYNIKRLTG